MAIDGAEEKLSDVERRIDTLNARSEAYSSEALEQAGTVVLLDYYGWLAIERGFVKARQAFAVLVLIFRRLKFSRERPVSGYC